MAINSTNGGDNLTRINTVLDPTADWTIGLWIRRGATTPSGGNFRSYWQFGDLAFINPVFWLGTNPGTNDLIFEYFNGTVYVDTSGFTLAAATWYYVTITYNSTINDVNFYVDGNLIDTVNYDISLVPFVETDEKVGPDDWGDTTICFLREFQAELSDTQIAQEQVAAFRVNSGVISDSKLPDTTVISDWFTTTWTANGAGLAYLQGPLTTQTEFGIGCSWKEFGPYANATNPLLFTAKLNNDAFRLFNNAGGWGGSGACPGTTRLNSPSAFLRLIYTNNSTAPTPNTTVDIPYTSALAGVIVGNEPTVDSVDFQRVAVLCRTSTYDKGFAGSSPANAYQSDGYIELFLDGVSIFSNSSFFLKRTGRNVGNYPLPLPQLALSAGHGGFLTDSLWVTADAVMPTFSGPEDTPSSANLVAFFDWAAGAYTPFTKINFFGDIFLNPVCGLDGGYCLAAQTNYDPTTQPSNGNLATCTQKSLYDTMGSIISGSTSGYLFYDAFTLSPTVPTDIDMTMSGGLELDGLTEIVLFADLSGIYIMVVGKTDDTYYGPTSSPGSEIDVKIPDPIWKTGYIGG